MHLDAEVGNLVGRFGEPALDHRRHEINEGLLLLAHPFIVMVRGLVLRGRRDIGQRTHRLGLCLHQHQHASHIRVIDDGHGIRRAFDGAALYALLRIGQRVLVSRLGQPQPLEADGITRRVHHDEHVLQALVRLADEGADTATVVAETHHAGRAGMDAELVFDGYTVGIVAFAERTIGIDEKLWHDEQRDAFHPGWRVGQTGQHEVDDVLGHVVLAVGDKDLLAEDAVTAVRLRLGTRADRGEIRPGLRLGDIHGAGPFAGNHFRQVHGLLLRRAAQFQCLDCTAGQHRTQREGMVGRLPHLAYGGGNQARQALPAEFSFMIQPVPAVFDKLAVGIAKTGRHLYDLVRSGVLPDEAGLVANVVEWRQHATGKLPRLLENCINDIGIGFFATRQRRHVGEAGKFLEHELHVLQRGGVVHGHSSFISFARDSAGRRSCRPSAGNRPPSG